jgi:hypothetical protein
LYAFRVTATDAAGNTSAPTAKNIYLDKTPPQGTVSIKGAAGGTVTTNTVALDLVLTSNDQASSIQMSFSNSGGEETYSTWEPFSSTKLNYQLTNGMGSKSVYMRLKDAAGNVSATSVNVVVTSRVIINDGASTTFSRNITLHLTPPVGAVDMAISEDGSFPSENWVAVSTTASATLIPGKAVNTIYVKFRSASPAQSLGTYSASVQLQNQVYIRTDVNIQTLRPNDTFNLELRMANFTAANSFYAVEVHLNYYGVSLGAGTNESGSSIEGSIFDPATSVFTLNEMVGEGTQLVYVVSNFDSGWSGSENISLSGDGLLIKLPFRLGADNGYIEIAEVRVINKEYQRILPVNVGLNMSFPDGRD